jgi:DNA/RNA-binding domain of Phe-tRNA-synthetase-like protein
MVVRIHPDLQILFEDIYLKERLVSGVTVEEHSPALEKYKVTVILELKEGQAIEDLKNHRLIRAYRDLFWSLEIDPTKIRPAQEALIRRVLQGKPLPKINTAVDAYNVASIKTMVPFAAFDASKVKGDFFLRRAEDGEQFLGIGMEAPKTLTGNEILLLDEKEPIAIFPYRDADRSKITLETTDIMVIACGAPGVHEDIIEDAIRECARCIQRFCKE